MRQTLKSRDHFMKRSKNLNDTFYSNLNKTFEGWNQAGSVSNTMGISPGDISF
jgi:hypothetical protein